MSITPHRDAAVATVAATRAHFARQPPADPSVTVARRMDADACEAVMVGYADLRDLGVDHGRTGSIVARVLASAVASWVATICGGRQDVGRALLDVTLDQIRGHALDRLAKVESEGISAKVTPSEPRGRA